MSKSSVRYEKSIVISTEKAVSEDEIREINSHIEELERTTNEAIQSRNQKIALLNGEIEKYKQLLRSKENEVGTLYSLSSQAKRRIDPEFTDNQTLCELLDKERSVVEYHLNKQKGDYASNISLIESWGEQRRAIEAKIARIQRDNQEMKERTLKRLLQLQPNPGQPLLPPGGYTRTLFDRYDTISDDEVRFTLKSKLGFFSEIHRKLDERVREASQKVDVVLADVKKQEVVEKELLSSVKESQEKEDLVIRKILSMKSVTRFRGGPFGRGRWTGNFSSTLHALDSTALQELEIRKEETKAMKDRLHSVQTGGLGSSIRVLYDECGKMLAVLMMLGINIENIQGSIDQLREQSLNITNQMGETSQTLEEHRTAHAKVYATFQKNQFTFTQLCRTLEMVKAKLTSMEDQVHDSSEDLRIIDVAIDMVVECVRSTQDAIAVEHQEFEFLLNQDAIIVQSSQRQQQQYESLKTSSAHSSHVYERDHDISRSDRLRRNKNPSDSELSGIFESIHSKVDRLAEKSTINRVETASSRVDYDQWLEDQVMTNQQRIDLKEKMVSILTHQLSLGIQGINNIWKIVTHVLKQLPPPPPQTLIKQAESGADDENDSVPKVRVQQIAEKDSPKARNSPASALIEPDYPPINISPVIIPPPDDPISISLAPITNEFRIDGIFEDSSILKVGGGNIIEGTESPSFQWSKRKGLEGFSPIPGATESQYRTSYEDIGFSFRCEIKCGERVYNVDTPAIREGVPRVASATIKGGPYHTVPLTVDYVYSGGREGNTLVQWFRCSDNRAFISIPGAKGSKYEPTPDDFGCALRVEITPIRSDGLQGNTFYVDVNRDLYRPDPEILHVAQTSALSESPSFRVQIKSASKDKYESRILLLSKEYIKIQKAVVTRLRIPIGASLKVTLDILNNTKFSIHDTSGVYEFTAENPRVRDVITLVIRDYHSQRWKKPTDRNHHSLEYLLNGHHPADQSASSAGGVGSHTSSPRDSANLTHPNPYAASYSSQTPSNQQPIQTNK